MCVPLVKYTVQNVACQFTVRGDDVSVTACTRQKRRRVQRAQGYLPFDHRQKTPQCGSLMHRVGVLFSLTCLFN